jgi:hypothetical protein
MNRHQRRADTKRNCQLATKPLDRAKPLRIAAALIEADNSVSGITLFTPDGEASYVDAGTIRRGGRA